MSGDARITCPSCAADIPLSESLAGPLLAEARAEGARALEAERAKAAEALEAAKKEAAAAAEAERARIVKAATEEAQAKVAEDAARAEAQAKSALAERDAELAKMRADAEVRDQKLKDATAAKLAALQKEQEVAERLEALDLEVAQKVAAERKAMTEKLIAQRAEMEAQRIAEVREEEAQKLGQATEQIEQMRRQIEALKRKSEQGSMQTQGEAGETRLEQRLSDAFRADRFEEVGKGIRGGDCIQRVGEAGAILWEVKETANWSNAWVPKLREDQRTAGAEVAVLVSRVRPEGVESFTQIDGVWICAPQFATPLAAALRAMLIEVAQARTARQGQATKSEMLYDYFTGPEFRARLEAVADPFVAMQTSLQQEKRAMQKHWAAREKQMERVIGAIAGMQGDVEGITGQRVEALDAVAPALLGDDDD